MKPAPFRHYVPAPVEEAVALLARLAPEDGRVLAGGQSLVPTMAFRLARPAHLIDINGIAALERLAVADGKLTIGACVRHAAFHRPPVDGALGALLARVVCHIAHDAIRARGRFFCGSIANADRASEWCTLAVALGAEMVAKSTRRTPANAAIDFFAGIMTTALPEDELLSEVRLLPPGTRVGSYEFSRRAGDFAIAMALVTFSVDGGKIVSPRIAVGGAEPHLRRIERAEEAVAGEAPGPAAFAAAAVQPMEDAQNTAQDRRDLVRTVTPRALEQAA